MSERLIFTKELPDGKRQELYEPTSGTPEIFIDGAWGTSTSPLHFKINLFTTAVSGDKDVERREVAVRLVMPINALFELKNYLDKQWEVIIERGLVDVLPPPEDEKEVTSATPENDKSSGTS